MSLRLETLQVAKLAPRLLGDASELVADFARGRFDDATGGVLDRDETPDLYYTIFGLDCLHALDVEVPTGDVERYLRSFDGGEALDFVHFSCLVRCWAALPASEGPSITARDAMLTRLEASRTSDGGYADRPVGASGQGTGSDVGSIYGSFIALGAYQDLGMAPPDPDGLADFVAANARSDGAYADGGDQGAATLPVTAAAANLLRNLGRPASTRTVDWLLSQRHAQGGFMAAPGAPMPDLLSTAVAVHTLAGLEHPLDAFTDPMLDFVDTLWTNRGAFHGHWADDDIDCEYTYYGLLTLGHLSVWTR